MLFEEKLLLTLPLQCSSSPSDAPAAPDAAAAAAAAAAAPAAPAPIDESQLTSTPAHALPFTITGIFQHVQHIRVPGARGAKSIKSLSCMWARLLPYNEVATPPATKQLPRRSVPVFASKPWHRAPYYFSLLFCFVFAFSFTPPHPSLFLSCLSPSLFCAVFVSALPFIHPPSSYLFSFIRNHSHVFSPNKKQASVYAAQQATSHPSGARQTLDLHRGVQHKAWSVLPRAVGSLKCPKAIVIIPLKMRVWGLLAHVLHSFCCFHLCLVLYIFFSLNLSTYVCTFSCLASLPLSLGCERLFPFVLLFSFFSIIFFSITTSSSCSPIECAAVTTECRWYRTTDDNMIQMQR